MTLSKELTKREKIMIIVLALIIIAVGWLKLLYEPTMAEIASLDSQRNQEQTDIEMRIPKVAKIKSMKEELEILKADKNVTTIPLYDNSKPIMNTINSVMKGVSDYSIEFLPDKTNGYIVEHPIRLTYVTDTYANARKFFDRLDKETFVNQISDLSISTNDTKDGVTTSVSMLITFFDLKN